MKDRPALKRFAALACLLLCGVLGIAVWRYLEHRQSVAVPLPLHTVKFADGSVMDVTALGSGMIRYPNAPAGKRLFGVESHSQSTYAHGFFHGGGFETQTLTENGAKAWSAQQQGAKPLLLGIRLNDASGRPLDVPRAFCPQSLHEERRLLESTSSLLKDVPTSDLIGDDAAAALKKHGLAFTIQHHDPDAGWVVMSGPLWIGEEYRGHHVMALSVWRRDLKTLKFRLIRDDGEIHEFELPAPVTPASDTRTITPEPIPITRAGGDYQVKLENVAVTRSPGRSPMLHAEPVLESSRYRVGDEPDAHLEGQIIGLRDEAGNLDPFQIYDRKAMCGFFQANSRKLELLYQVERRPAFPTPVADCLIIADAEVMEDGTTLRVTNAPEGTAAMGLKKIEITPIRSSADEFWGDAAGEHVITLTVAGDITEAAMPARFKAHTPDKLRLVVFREGEDESSGIPWFQGSGLTSRSGRIGIGKMGASASGWDYRRSEEWYAPAGALKPGSRIRIAMAAPLEDEIHVFPFEVPAEAFEE